MDGHPAADRVVGRLDPRQIADGMRPHENVLESGLSGIGLDAGNAFGGLDGADPLSPFALRTAVGAGVRWRSPIGPLRFELGFPLKPQEGERRSVFDFGIGSFF